MIDTDQILHRVLVLDTIVTQTNKFDLSVCPTMNVFSVFIEDVTHCITRKQGQLLEIRG